MNPWIDEVTPELRLVHRSTRAAPGELFAAEVLWLPFLGGSYQVYVRGEWVHVVGAQRARSEALARAKAFADRLLEQPGRAA